jgi:hypothetical protein
MRTPAISASAMSIGNRLTRIFDPAMFSALATARRLLASW